MPERCTLRSTVSSCAGICPELGPAAIVEASSLLRLYSQLLRLRAVFQIAIEIFAELEGTAPVKQLLAVYCYTIKDDARSHTGVASFFRLKW